MAAAAARAESEALAPCAGSLTKSIAAERARALNPAPGTSPGSRAASRAWCGAASAKSAATWPVRPTAPDRIRLPAGPMDGVLKNLGRLFRRKLCQKLPGRGPEPGPFPPADPDFSAACSPRSRSTAELPARARPYRQRALTAGSLIRSAIRLALSGQCWGHGNGQGPKVPVAGRGIRICVRPGQAGCGGRAGPGRGPPFGLLCTPGQRARLRGPAPPAPQDRRRIVWPGPKSFGAACAPRMKKRLLQVRPGQIRQHLNRLSGQLAQGLGYQAGRLKLRRKNSRRPHPSRFSPCGAVSRRPGPNRSP